MEFTGRIAKVLPLRSGISQKTGNEWKALPFVFEYFEHDTDRWPDSVVLETFDTKVIENLKEGMEVRCGFGHKAKTITKNDGTSSTFTEIRLYKIECVSLPKEATGGANDGGAENQSTTQTNAPQNEPNNNDDDLPF